MTERDVALIVAWYGTETMVEIGRRFGMTARSVEWNYERLMKAGRVPAQKRRHAGRFAGKYADSLCIDYYDTPITVGEDKLLARLIEVHGWEYLLGVSEERTRGDAVAESIT